MRTDDTSGGPTALPQGDLRLETDQARRLLAAPLPARYAYTATDGTPRVLPSWFHWTALRTNPDVAVTIDTEAFPPDVLLLRGRAVITEVDGVAPEYALAARRYLGDPAATTYLAQLDQPGTRMARYAVRPTWVGLLDFQRRLPAGFAQ